MNEEHPKERRARVLVADDQPDVVESLRILLKNEGFSVVTASSPPEVLKAVTETEIDAALIDLNYARDTTSGEEGLDLLTGLQAHDSGLPVVVMTAWGSVDIAVRAMRSGARDFIEKPWENERLLTVLRTQIELADALRRGRSLEAENRFLRASKPSTLIAGSPAMRPVLKAISRVGPSDANVLITGEHGTGKEVVARAVYEASGRSSQPLITVNSGGLSDALFASELFGHVRGAFTDASSDRVGRFEAAHRGTLFLDEIANVPFEQQATLLRVLETGELERVGSTRSRVVDVRVLSATNADLAAAVLEQRFREDLLFRLNTVEIRLPPLRDRREDIPLLAMHFLGHYGRRYRKEDLAFDDAAMQALVRHIWVGNVRELSHTIERAVLMSGEHSIRADDLGLPVAEGQVGNTLEDMTLEEVERILVDKAMRRYSGNVSRAADALGLSRSALYRRLEKHEL